MALRRGWLFWCCLSLGCQSLVLPDGDVEPEPAAVRQQDEQSNSERPLGFYDKDLATDEAVTRSPLSLASEELQKGNEAAACQHLGEYLATHPEHQEVRLHYAELLLRGQRRADACREFSRFIAQAQERGDNTVLDRIHCHSRLMDIAEADDDEYGVRYHRGVGIYLLALERAKLGDLNGPLPLEALLCRAAGELTSARSNRPGEAQPCWYLYQVWSALGQPTAALRWLQRAQASAPFSSLTPAEQRGLELAIRMRNTPAGRF